MRLTRCITCATTIALILSCHSHHFGASSLSPALSSLKLHISQHPFGFFNDSISITNVGLRGNYGLVTSSSISPGQKILSVPHSFTHQDDVLFDIIDGHLGAEDAEGFKQLVRRSSHTDIQPHIRNALAMIITTRAMDADPSASRGTRESSALTSVIRRKAPSFMEYIKTLKRECVGGVTFAPEDVESHLEHSAAQMMILSSQERYRSAHSKLFPRAMEWHPSLFSSSNRNEAPVLWEEFSHAICTSRSRMFSPQCAPTAPSFDRRRRPPQSATMEFCHPGGFVPLFDMLNHSPNPNVYVVPEARGLSLYASSDVLKGEELLLSYGELPNFSLLDTYGFTMEHNKHDYIPFSTSALLEIYTSVEQNFINAAYKAALLSWWNATFIPLHQELRESTLRSLRLLSFPSGRFTTYEITRFTHGDSVPPLGKDEEIDTNALTVLYLATVERMEKWGTDLHAELSLLNSLEEKYRHCGTRPIPTPAQEKSHPIDTLGNAQHQRKPLCDKHVWRQWYFAIQRCTDLNLLSHWEGALREYLLG